MTPMTRIGRLGLVLAFIAPLAGCGTPDPFAQPGTWSVEAGGDVNAENLAAMVVNPRDLSHGEAESSSLGAEAAPPVTRLLTDKRTPLPATSALSIDQLAASPPPPPTPGDGANAGQ